MTLLRCARDYDLCQRKDFTEITLRSASAGVSVVADYLDRRLIISVSSRSTEHTMRVIIVRWISARSSQNCFHYALPPMLLDAVEHAHVSHIHSPPWQAKKIGGKGEEVPLHFANSARPIRKIA